MRSGKISQELIVTILAALMFVGFSLGLNNFLSPGNLFTLLKNVAILGTLAIGMGLVVVGRGIDLSMVATMVVGVAFSIWLAERGLPFGYALVLGAALCLALGLATGLLIAFGEVPPLFATLGTASVIFGTGRVVFKTDVMYLPAAASGCRSSARARSGAFPLRCLPSPRSPRSLACS